MNNMILYTFMWYRYTRLSPLLLFMYATSSEVLDVEAPVYSGLKLYDITVTAQLCIYRDPHLCGGRYIVQDVPLVIVLYMCIVISQHLTYT